MSTEHIYPSTRIRLARYAALATKERAQRLGCTDWQAHVLARRAAHMTGRASPEFAIQAMEARAITQLEKRHV